MVDNRHFAHLVKFAQRGGLVDVRKNGEVADALGARFALVQARPRLVTLVHHIALILFTVCHKPIALGNDAGAVLPRVAIIQPRLIAVHRTHDGIPPYCQSQR